MAKNFMQIQIRGVHQVRQLSRDQFGEGAYELIIPSQPISRQQNELLDELFPNTMRQIDAALQAEALIACCTSAKAHAPVDEQI